MSASTNIPVRRPWIENRATRRWWPRLGVREIWTYRDVGLILAHRDLKVRYKQTFFGVGWAVLQPLLALALFTLILSRGAGIPSDGVPYTAFAIAGLAVWFPFNTALGAGSDCLVRDPELVTKVYFPRLLAPLGACLAPLVDLGVSLVIALVVVVAAGVAIPWTVILLPVCAIGAIGVWIAFALWLSALNVLYRDVRYALGFATQILFFASPVVYPSSVAGDQWQNVLAINPLVGLIDSVRWALLGVPLPTTAAIISLASATALLAGGLIFFRRAERHFADRI
jgi:ABC-type polysaccharide/polyol phosphate export permease